MRGDLPGIAPSVFYHTTTVAIGHLGWLFERSRAGVESALIRRVGIADVYVEKGGHRAANFGVADHDLRIADHDHGWNVLPIFSRCAEHLLEKLHELLRVVNYDSWSNRAPAFRDEMGTVGCLFHRMIPWFKERSLALGMRIYFLSISRHFALRNCIDLRCTR